MTFEHDYKLMNGEFTLLVYSHVSGVVS